MGEPSQSYLTTELFCIATTPEIREATTISIIKSYLTSGYFAQRLMKFEMRHPFRKSYGPFLGRRGNHIKVITILQTVFCVASRLVLYSVGFTGYKSALAPSACIERPTTSQRHQDPQTWITLCPYTIGVSSAARPKGVLELINEETALSIIDSRKKCNSKSSYIISLSLAPKHPFSS